MRRPSQYSKDRRKVYCAEEDGEPMESTVCVLVGLSEEAEGIIQHIERGEVVDLLLEVNGVMEKFYVWMFESEYKTGYEAWAAFERAMEGDSNG